MIIRKGNIRFGSDLTRLLKSACEETGNGRKPSVFTGGSHAWLCLCIASRTRCNPGGGCAGYARRESPRARGIVSRSNPQRTAFLASMIVLGSCGAGGRPPFARSVRCAKELGAIECHRSGGAGRPLTIDVDVTDATGKPVWDLTPSDFTLLDTKG
jgi:hypothetical protein